METGEEEDCAKGMEQQTARAMEMRMRREEDEEDERFEGCLFLEGGLVDEEEEEEEEEEREENEKDEEEDGEEDGKDKGAGADDMDGKEEEDPAKGGKTENEDIIVVLDYGQC